MDRIMTSLAGRPAVGDNTSTISLRLSDHSVATIDAGAKDLGALYGHSPSRAAWMRQFLYSTFNGNDMAAVLPSDRYYMQYPTERLEQATHRTITVLLGMQHRIWLRQFECYVQALDWQREVSRNVAIYILIEEHAAVFNALIKRSIKEKAAD